MKIRKVHAHYSFGDGSRLDRTAYSEQFQPEIEACCVAPEKFKDRMTRFTLIGDRSNECDLWVQTYALEKHEAGVGTLTFRGDRSDYLGSLPFDALWNVVATALAGGFRFIYMHGAPVKNGSARIKSISFYEEFDLENA